MKAPPRRNRRVYFEFHRLEPNGAGGFKDYWTDPIPVWAEMVPLSGDRSVDRLVMTARQTWKVTIRWRGDLTAEWRMTFADRPLAIIGEPIDPDGRRRWLTMTCESGVKT